jgi:hypothetical protein
VVSTQLALQKAVVAALKGNTDAGDSVFDDVPSSNPFPRITIGPAQALPNLADCMDGTETFLQVDVWSRNTPGMVEMKTIAGQVRSILQDSTMSLDDNELQLMTVDSEQFLRDPDGLTKHAALTFRALTQPTEET